SLFFFSQRYATPGALHSFPTRRSSDLQVRPPEHGTQKGVGCAPAPATLLIHLEIGAAEIAAAVEHLHRRDAAFGGGFAEGVDDRSEEHTSELQSRENLVCRLLLEKKKK